MIKKKYSLILAVSICTIVLASIAITIWYQSQLERQPVKASAIVSTAAVTVKNEAPTFDTIAKLVAIHGVTLGATAEGKITKIYFDSGQTVKKGQILLEINPDQLKATIAYDQAKLDNDHLAYNRQLQLIKNKFTSQSSLDSSLATYKEDIAILAKDNAALKDAIITAPFSGKIGLRDVQLGQYLDKGDTIADLEQLDPLWVDFSVPTKYLSKLKKGQKVSITSEAYSKEAFSGKLIAISSLVNTDSDSIDIRAQINNPNSLLVPGLLVNATLFFATAKPTITIPAISITYSDKGNFVYRVVDHKAIANVVTLGSQSGQNIIITAGLKAGDIIVTAGTNKVKENQTIIDSSNLNSETTIKSAS